MLIDKTEHKTKFQIACTIPLLHTVPASIVINENAIPIVATDKTVMYVYLRTFHASLVLNFTTNFYNSNCDQEVNKY
jgi:hypothetical protein